MYSDARERTCINWVTINAMRKTKFARAEDPRAEILCRLRQKDATASEPQRDAMTWSQQSFGAKPIASSRDGRISAYGVRRDGYRVCVRVVAVFVTTSYTRACVRRAVFRQRGAHGSDTTRARKHDRRNRTRDAAGTSSHGGARAPYFAPSTGRRILDEATMWLTTTTLLHVECEKYVAPKTFCATTNFLLWLISRRGNSAGLESFRRRSVPRTDWSCSQARCQMARLTRSRARDRYRGIVRVVLASRFYK